MFIPEIEDKHTRIQEQVFSTIYLQDADGSSSFPIDMRTSAFLCISAVDALF